MTRPYSDEHVRAILTVLEDHERARAGRPCGCVKCRIISELDHPSYKHRHGLRAIS